MIARGDRYGRSPSGGVSSRRSSNVSSPTKGTFLSTRDGISADDSAIAHQTAELGPVSKGTGRPMGWSRVDAVGHRTWGAGTGTDRPVTTRCSRPRPGTPWLEPVCRTRTHIISVDSGDERNLQAPVAALPQPSPHRDEDRRDRRGRQSDCPEATKSLTQQQKSHDHREDR